tara:strand:+ start:249 stop:800 length:552 start_codon:yes stop_codon:yes gene_type:complete
MNKFVILSLFFFAIIKAGEISVSISEDLVNDYLRLIGNHQIPKGKSDNQSLWSINEPRVSFLDGSAEFLATVLYNKGRINIKKTINKNMYVEYNYDKNIIQLMIEDPVIKMERKNEFLGKFDLSTLYQEEGLKFQGPRPKAETIKLKTVKGRIEIDMNIKKSVIYFEPGIVRVAIDLDYRGTQ